MKKKKNTADEAPKVRRGLLPCKPMADPVDFPLEAEQADEAPKVRRGLLPRKPMADPVDFPLEEDEDDVKPRRLVPQSSVFGRAQPRGPIEPSEPPAKNPKPAPPARKPPPATDFVGSRFQPTSSDERNKVFTPGWVVRITESKAEMVVLSRLAYRFGPVADWEDRRKRRLKGLRYVAKTYMELKKETFERSRDAVVRAVKNLKARGIIVAVRSPDNDATPLYRLDPTAIESALAAEKESARRRRRAKQAGAAGRGRMRTRTGKAAHRP